MTLATRPPTGEANWPMLMIEGQEATRKTSESLRLSLDPRIGDTYVIEVGERRVDEYATLGNFTVVLHDGTLRTILPAINEVMTLPPAGGKPNLLIIDSGTALWDKVKRLAEGIARGSNRAKRILEEDPDAEIDVGHQAWNRAKDDSWWGWLNDMRGWPGILLMTCRSDEVAKFLDGRPIANQKDYRIDIERGTRFIFDGIVRMRGAQPALLTVGKSMKFSVPDGGLELPAEGPLAHVVFDLFQAGTEITLTVAQAKTTLVTMARQLGHDDESAKTAAADAWRKANGQLGRFDHAAVARLVEALEPPGAGAPTVPGEAPESPQDASDPPEAPVIPPEPSEAPMAPLPLNDETLTAGTILAHDAVAAMKSNEVNDMLRELGLPIDGYLPGRRERLVGALAELHAAGATGAV